MSKHIIIDTDPGIDDAFAILYALKNPDFKIEGITTVSGNNSIDQVTENALKLVELAGQDIPVYQGEGQPLVRPVSQGDGCHGDDGLGGAGQDLPFGQKEDLPAVDFILDRARELDGLTLVTLGPLTNLARAIEREPETMKRLEGIVSMGGGIGQGNVTDYAEFNYWADPEAAQQVFDFSIPIVMVGLNATNYSYFTREELDYLASSDLAEAQVLYEMQQVYTAHYSSTYDLDGCRIHDLLAMVLAGQDQLGWGSQGEIQILLDDERRGESRPDYRPDGKVLIIEEIDVAAYKEEFFSRLLGLDRKEGSCE